MKNDFYLHHSKKPTFEPKNNDDYILAEASSADSTDGKLQTNMKKASSMLFCISFIYLITFTIYPGAFFDGHLSFMAKFGDSQFTWYSLTAIMIFNTTDTIGRYLGGRYHI